MFKKHETIFILNYSGDKNKGFRREYFARKMTLKEFHDWLYNTVDEIEEKISETIVITSQQIIKNY